MKLFYVVRRSPMFALSAVVLLVLVLLALVAPSIWGQAAATTDATGALAGPSAAHILGTDSLGRDVFARVMVATRLSLVMALVGTGIAAVAGILLGALPSVFGARAQRMAGAVINTWLAFPVLLVAMLVVIMLNAGTVTAVVALAVTMTPYFARLTQTLTARIGGADYLAAARMLGVPRSRQLTRYIVPNIAELVVVNVTMSVGSALLALSSLSFLGVGVQPPTYDWGALLSDGFGQVYTNPMAAIGPGIVIVIAGSAFGMLGESFAGLLRAGSRTDVAKGAADTLPPQGDHALPQQVEGALLEVRDLRVAFPDGQGYREVVHGIDLVIMPGEIVGIAGESGSGKSVTMMAIAGLSDPAANVRARRLVFNGTDMLAATRAERERVGRGFGIVYQDSLGALNPAMRVGTQIEEVPRFQQGASRRDARHAAVAALDSVAIPGPARRARQFPHEFSGGMRQRAVIAMAEIQNPAMLIADEPTTALDVTVQRQVLTLLRAECAATGQAAVVVSHDIAVLGELCQRIVVMYHGEVVDDFPSIRLREPWTLTHPYARALVEASPDLSTDVSQPLPTVSSAMARYGVEQSYE